MLRRIRRALTRDRAWVGRLASLLRTVRIEGCRFRVDSPLISDALKSRLLYRRYERSERELLRRYLPSSLPVIELGGGIGVVACIANRRLDDPTRHVVVEANGQVLGLLEAHRAMNGGRFEVVHAAVGYGRAALAVEQGPDILGAITVAPSGRDDDVPSVSVASLAYGRGFERCALICDIEGAEIELVRHEAPFLAASVLWFFVEEHAERNDEAARRAMGEGLAAAGFERVETLRKVTVFRNRRL